MKPEEEKYILANLHTKSVKQMAQNLNLKERRVKRFIEKICGSTVKKTQAVQMSRPAAISSATPALVVGKAFVPLAFLFLTLWGSLVYSNSFHTSFQLDDKPMIVENTVIKDIGNLNVIWDEFNARFIVGLSLAMNYHFGKLNVFGYHLFNFVVHLLCAFLIFGLTSLLLQIPNMPDGFVKNKRYWFALFSALIFMTHPIQTQGVTYIWQRCASMAALFYLAAVTAYLKARLKFSPYYYGAAIISTLLAVFTKQNVITLPGMLLVSELLLFGNWKHDLKKRLYLLLPFVFVMAILPAVHFNLPKTALLKPLEMVSLESDKNFSRKSYYLTELNVVRTYLRLLVFPVRQSVTYNYPASKTLWEPMTFYSLLLILGILFGGWFAVVRNRLIAYGIFWFFISILVETLIPLPDVIFEHRLYLPMAGFAIFLPAFLAVLSRNFKITVAVLIVSILLFSGATYQRNKVWKDERTLWEDALLKFPDNVRPMACLGTYYIEHGDFAKAAEYFEKQVKLDPNGAGGFNSLGSAYRLMGDHEKALKCFEKAMDLVSKNSDQYQASGIYSNLGIYYSEQGNMEKAIEYYKKAVEMDPLLVHGYTNLCVAYFNMGQYPKAVEYGEKAVQIDPDFVDAQYNLGVAYLHNQQMEKAVGQVHILREDLKNEELASKLEGIINRS